MTIKEMQILVAEILAKIQILNSALNKNEPKNISGTVDKSQAYFEIEEGVVFPLQPEEVESYEETD